LNAKVGLALSIPPFGRWRFFSSKGSCDKKGGTFLIAKRAALDT
jgi:hypothetical protein